MLGPNGSLEAEFPLTDINTIGRHPNNSIQILDKVVSKEHAVVDRIGDKFLLRDLDSRNGTFINSQRVKEKVLLDRDEIAFGSKRLIFVWEMERTEDSSILERVTIAPDRPDQTYIKTRFNPEDVSQFLPAKQVTDNDVLRRDYEKLRVAYELNRGLGLELKIDSLLEKILEKAFEIFPADRGVILLMDEGKLVPKVVKLRGKHNEEGIDISRTIADSVCRNKQAILSSDATMDSRFGAAQSVIIQGIRSTMCVPILHKDKLFGILHLDTQDATGAFTEKDLQLLSTFVGQAAIAIENTFLAKQIENEAINRDRLQRFLSPNLVEEVLSGQIELKPGGELKDVTILFVDIRGFTALTERQPPQEIVQMLNEFFEVMVDVIFLYQGTVDKYIGDSIMAIWGAPVAQADASLKAVTAAVSMREALVLFNQKRITNGKSPIQVGWGLDTGEIVAGAMGHSQTVDYTVIGDSVNLASRLVSLAKSNQIIISENTKQCIQEHVFTETLTPTKVKGREEVVSIFNVLGLREQTKAL